MSVKHKQCKPHRWHKQLRIFTNYLKQSNNNISDILLHSLCVCYYVEIKQLPSLLSSLHSLYWTDITVHTFLICS